MSGIDNDTYYNFIKLIIMDNASSHRNKKVKEVIEKDNNLLYSIPYQHFTNTIEQYFSILKSKLRKTHDIGLQKLKKNVNKIIKEIPKKSRLKPLKHYK
jgi:hypothetical protein